MKGWNAKALHTPFEKIALDGLQVGDAVLLSGLLFTGRDAVLPRLVQSLEDGTYDGPRLEGGALFHTAVSSAGVGPTSSNKLEIESSILPLSSHGLLLHIGKGALKRETVIGLAEYGAIYAVTPPVTALFNGSIVSKTVVYGSDLGMEAMNLLSVHDFPLIVAAAKGVSIYDGRV